MCHKVCCQNACQQALYQALLWQMWQGNKDDHLFTWINECLWCHCKSETWVPASANFCLITLRSFMWSFSICIMQGLHLGLRRERSLSKWPTIPIRYLGKAMWQLQRSLKGMLTSNIIPSIGSIPYMKASILSTESFINPLLQKSFSVGNGVDGKSCSADCSFSFPTRQLWWGHWQSWSQSDLNATAGLIYRAWLLSLVSLMRIQLLSHLCSLLKMYELSLKRLKIGEDYLEWWISFWYLAPIGGTSAK